MVNGIHLGSHMELFQGLSRVCLPGSPQLGHSLRNFLSLLVIMGLTTNLMRLFSLGVLQVLPVPSCFSNE